MLGTGGVKETKYNEMDLLILDILGKDNTSVEGLCSGECFEAEETVVGQLQAVTFICIAAWYTLSIFCWKWKQECIHRSSDTPCISPTIWYCPPVPCQCSAIYSNCFSLRARLHLSSWSKKGPTTLRRSPSHYNTLCYCKFFVLESPQVHSVIPNHWTTYWPNLTLNTMSSLSCITHSSEPD